MAIKAVEAQYSHRNTCANRLTHSTDDPLFYSLNILYIYTFGCSLVFYCLCTFSWLVIEEWRQKKIFLAFHFFH